MDYRSQGDNDSIIEQATNISEFIDLAHKFSEDGRTSPVNLSEDNPPKLKRDKSISSIMNPDDERSIASSITDFNNNGVMLQKGKGATYGGRYSHALGPVVGRYNTRSMTSDSSAVSSPALEFSYFQPHVAKPPMRLTSTSKQNIKSVSGSQFRLISRSADQHPCGNCLNIEKANKKMKETIRSLKFQIQKLEREYHDLRMSRKSNHLHHHSHLHHHTPEPSSNNSNTQATHDTTSLATVANSISEQEGDGEAEEECENCFRYKEELKTTRRLLAYERTSNEGLRKAFFELRGALEGDIFEAKSLTFKLEAEVSSLKDEKRIFDRENNKLKNQLTVTKEQLNITNIKLNECEIRLRSSAGTNADIDQLKDLEELKETLRLSEEELKKAQEATLEKVTHIQRTEESLRNAKFSLMNIEREKQQIEDREKTATDAFHGEKHKVAALENQIKGFAVDKEHHATKMSELYYSNKDMVGKLTNLEAENKSLIIRIADLSKQIVTDTLNNKKVMEKAITGSVKLCVVAPTVNVHVANKKLKFKSGLSHQALNDFLNTEILTKYSFLYKQKQDNSSPEGGDLESFLQQMLQQMQVSIEQHVNSAMDGTNGG